MHDAETWPEAADADGWSRLADAGRLRSCPPGTVVSALRALRAAGQTKTADTLYLHLDGLVTGGLRHYINTPIPGSDDPRFDRARTEILQALINPRHADYEGVAVAFWPRLRWRALDAIRKAARERAHVESYDADPAGVDGALATADGGRTSMAVEAALARIPDPRKRLAFRLYIEGAQIRTGKNNIAAAIGIDPKTAKSWIEEVRAALKAQMKTEIGA